MAQSQQSQSKGKNMGQCLCGAVVFDEIPRGEIIDGAFVKRQLVYVCIKCGKEQQPEQMIDRPIPQPVI